MSLRHVNSDFKPVFWTRELEAFRSGSLVYPHLIQMDLASGCNHNCTFCSYRYEKNEDRNALMDFRDKISLADVQSILADGVDMGVKAVELTGGGEPSLHRDFCEVLSSIYDYGLELGVVTNGVGHAFKYRLEETVSLLSEAEWVRFSVNGGTAESYSFVHDAPKSDFDLVAYVISRLLDKASDNTAVGVSFVATYGNLDDVPDIASLCYDLGVGYLRITPAIFGDPDSRIGLADRDIERVSLSVCEAQDWYHDMVIINGFDRVTYEDYEYGDECYLSGVHAVVGADMRLYPCCMWKYRPFGVIGNLGIGLKSLWESDERREYYERLDISESCVNCYYKGKNDCMKSLLNGHKVEGVAEPVHVNFL